MGISVLHRIALVATGVLVLLSTCGCVDSRNAFPEEGPSTVAVATPAAASAYGAEVHWVEAGVESPLAGAANRSGSESYDPLILRIEGAAKLDYEEFLLAYPAYTEWGWEERGDAFLIVDIEVRNTSEQPVTFDVEGLSAYTEAMRLYDDSGWYWAPVLSSALAEQYGTLDADGSDLGGSWEFPDGWNEIEGGDIKRFSIPFVINPKEVLNGSLDDVGTGDFYLEVYGACSDADIARGATPSDCYLFALPEEGAE